MSFEVKNNRVVCVPREWTSFSCLTRRRFSFRGVAFSPEDVCVVLNVYIERVMCLPPYLLNLINEAFKEDFLSKKGRREQECFCTRMQLTKLL